MKSGIISESPKFMNLMAMMLGEAQLGDEHLHYVYIVPRQRYLLSAKRFFFKLCEQSQIQCGEVDDQIVTYIDGELSKRFEFIAIDSINNIDHKSLPLARVFVDLTDAETVENDFVLTHLFRPCIASAEDWIS